MDYRVEQENRNLKADEILTLKQEQAAERQATHDALTVEQKIAKLDSKLGKGKGAKKERARLLATPTVVAEETPKKKRKKKK